jgi:hypothetical protein
MYRYALALKPNGDLTKCELRRLSGCVICAHCDPRLHARAAYSRVFHHTVADAKSITAVATVNEFPCGGAAGRGVRGRARA